MQNKKAEFTPKLSFIIPTHNAEKYIEKCISSLLSQTYQNIEIIIINDGSTDDSEKIITDLQKRDSRIIVRNIQNGGVSNARNVGFGISSGDYISFIDADDYVSEDYAEYMLSLAESGSDFCLSKKCFTSYKDKQTDIPKNEIISPQEATALLLSPEVIVGCWNKIFKSSFLKENNLTFSTELFYGEGLTYIVSAAQKSNFVAVGNRRVYYYRRNNDVSATTKFNIEKFRNGEKALQKIKENIFLSDAKIETFWNLHFHIFVLGAMVKIKQNRKMKDYREDYIHYRKLLRRNLLELIFSGDVSNYRKSLLLAGCISPGILSKFDYYRRKKIAKNSI